MEFVCTQSDLKAALDTTKRIASSKSTLPALSCVLISAENNATNLRTTNLEQYAIRTLPAKVKEAGQVLVDVSLLSEFVSTLPDSPVKIATKGKKVQVECERITSNLSCLDPEDFPVIPTVPTTFEFDGIELKKAITRSVYAAASDDSRPTLTGMLMQGGDNFTVACADGFRLSCVQLPISAEAFNVIVPARTMRELARVLNGNVRIGVGDRAITFKMDVLEIGSRLIEGQFPPFERIIPGTGTTQITVSVADLYSSVKNVSVFLGGAAGQSVKLDAKKNSLQVSAKDNELGDSTGTLDCTTEGEPMTFALNPKYLSELLTAIGTEKATFCLTSPTTPVLILPVGDGADRHVLMPMQSNR